MSETKKTNTICSTSSTTLPVNACPTEYPIVKFKAKSHIDVLELI